jgi:hypothetical protein
VDDILLERRTDINGKLAFLDYLFKAIPILWKCKGYDIVQLNGPMFLEFKGSYMKPFYDFLRSHNRKVVMGAFGDDYHIVERMLNSDILRYSDQRIGQEIREDEAAKAQREEWIQDSNEQQLVEFKDWIVAAKENRVSEAKTPEFLKQDGFTRNIILRWHNEEKEALIQYLENIL